MVRYRSFTRAGLLLESSLSIFFRISSIESSRVIPDTRAVNSSFCRRLVRSWSGLLVGLYLEQQAPNFLIGVVQVVAHVLSRVKVRANYMVSVLSDAPVHGAVRSMDRTFR